MVGGRGGFARGAVAGLSLFLSVAAPALAEEPSPETKLIVQPETKILLVEPASTTSTSPTTVVRRAAPAPSPTIAADSPALRALVEAAAAERRRLAAEIAGAEARLATLEAELPAAERALSAGHERLATLELELARARDDAERAAATVRQLQPSAAAAAEAVAPHRTPVARPPAPGRTLREAAAQARLALDEALTRRVLADRVVAEREADVEPVRQANGGASAELTARLAEVAQARDALEGLRRQLVAAEQARPAVPDVAGNVSLVPQPSALAASTIPAAWRALYGRAAAACPGLPWKVLAAVGSIESAHGQSSAPGVREGANFAGAMGPMQFLAGTWAAYAVDGDRDGVRNVYDPDDAVFGASRYLCANGGGKVTSLRNALWNYNHADWYVEMVLALAARY